MDISRWFERIYSEEDFGRGIATSLSAAIGLTTYLVVGDPMVAIFGTVVMFPIARIVASALHKRGMQRAETAQKNRGIRETYERLSEGEKRVIKVFLDAGGTLITWGQFNRAGLPVSGIESLIQRQLLWSTVTADGMTEAFSIDTAIFDIAREMDVQNPQITQSNPDA